MYPRELTPEEQAWLELLLSRLGSDQEILRAQARCMRVGGECGTGPVSIRLLEVDDSHCVPCPVRDGPVAEDTGIAKTGEPVELRLQVDDRGFISELQILRILDES